MGPPIKIRQSRVLRPLQGTAVMDLVVYRPGQEVIGTYLITAVLL